MPTNDDSSYPHQHDDAGPRATDTRGWRAPHPRARARAARIASGERYATCDDAPPAGLLLGIHQFNAHEYFECHETLEGIWNLEPGPVRTLYKGILQVGVGCYHLLRGNYRGTTLKLESGADYLEAFAPRCMQVDVAGLIAQARRLREEVVRLGPERIADVERSLLPHIAVAL
jgi:predicted metal-dependent hydrolase